MDRKIPEFYRKELGHIQQESQGWYAEVPAADWNGLADSKSFLADEMFGTMKSLSSDSVAERSKVEKNKESSAYQIEINAWKVEIKNREFWIKRNEERIAVLGKEIEAVPPTLAEKIAVDRRHLDRAIAIVAENDQIDGVAFRERATPRHSGRQAMWIEPLWYTGNHPHFED